MTNTILRKRMIALIAMCYAMDTEYLYSAYEKLGSFDLLLQALETDTLKEKI